MFIMLGFILLSQQTLFTNTAGKQEMRASRREYTRLSSSRRAWRESITNGKNTKFVGKRGGLTWALEHESKSVALILSLESDNIVISRALENLGDAGEVEAEGKAAIASVMLEALASHQKRDEGNVGGIHCLEEKTR